MIKPVINSKMKLTVVTLIVNFLLSWTIMPLAVPPFGFYSGRELMEVLLWQGLGAVGWPLAILGGCASLILQGNGSELVALLIVLSYPAMLMLLVFVLFSRRSKRWALILLHMLLAFTFAAIWYQVRNGYNFMIG
jgi:hypothetical protein